MVLAEEARLSSNSFKDAAALHPALIGGDEDTQVMREGAQRATDVLRGLVDYAAHTGQVHCILH